MEDPVSQHSDTETNNWSLILHLSVFSGFIVPILGLVVPIGIFLLKKDQLPGLVPHGHVVFNWMISAMIYAVISTLLIFAGGLGILLLIVLAILCVVFPIIGAVKASDGEVWPYPLSIRIFK